jgi:MFS family permease
VNGPSPRRQIFAALRHREFRLFWIGLVLSLLGGWMQQFASPLLVYRLTGSAWALGLVGFVAAIPAAPLSLIAGPLIDRLPRRPLLVATQIGLLLPPLGVAVLIWSGKVQVWHIVVAELLRGAVLAIDQPAKQAAIVDMTGKEDIASAIGLWSSAISVTRVVGPALAGVLAAWKGEGLCFFLNGLSYLAVVAALLAISLPDPQPAARRRSLAGSLTDGLRYPFQTLMPVFALDVLGAGEVGLGLLSSAAGLGAVVGALGAASLHPHKQRTFVRVASLVLPFVAAGFAFSHSFALSCAFLVLLGGWETALETAVNSRILIEVEDEFRGRVISLYSAATMGAPRLGGLQAGWVASRWSAPVALGLGSVAYLLYSALALFVWTRWERSHKTG